jgi:alpha-tubulin suppressor-like RCC1 family protein
MLLNLEFDNKVLFNKLNKFFKKQIRYSLKTPNKLFIITEEDIFYEINIYDENFPSFVIYDHDSVIKSMIVKELSKQNIINLSYGFSHYIAWNDKREVFCWGNNSCGQFGNGKRDEEIIPADFLNDRKYTNKNFNHSLYYIKHRHKPELNSELSNLNIDVVKCGFWHSLALTKNGEVFVWGLISTDKFHEEICQVTPKKLDGFGGEKIVMISCGYKHSMALTESSRVFSWGKNIFGQLGTRNVICTGKPKLVDIEKAFFKKISCGKCHSLLLSNDGVIYAFGDNRCGQIGEGSSEEMIETPFKVSHMNKFNDIASNFIENISLTFD